MRVKLIQPLAATRPMDTSLKARMAPHLGLLTIAANEQVVSFASMP